MSDVLGFIFLFKWATHASESNNNGCDGSSPYFAKQVIQNACATQAIINILLNVKNEPEKGTTSAAFDLGETLKGFAEFTSDLDPEMRGISLGSCEHVRTVHNSYGKSESAIFDSVMQDKSKLKSDKDDPPFHFIAIVPKDNKIYELDGLKDRPIQHCMLNTHYFIYF